MRRAETGETYVREVSIELFQGEAFKNQLYLDKTEKLVTRGVEALRISKREPIHICTGYILSKASEALREAGFMIVNKRIRGETQALAEREFIRSLAKMSVGDEATIKRMRSFNAFLQWALEDLDSRERYVKTGWSSWSRLRRVGTS